MHLPHVLVDDLEGEVLLVCEVMIERAFRSPRGVQHGLSAEAMIPVLEQQPEADVEQTLPG
jgi:hypothetical protein